MANLEVCIDDATGLEACQISPPDFIELCSALALGGLTPSPGLMELASKQPIPTRAMIRPRVGGFEVDAASLDQMLGDISHVKSLGLEGVVFGALTPENRLDLAVLETLLKESQGLQTTLHRAFDMVPDQGQALEEAISLGFNRILTSGGARSALEGASRIRSIVEQADGRIEVMAGSGVTSHNVGQLIRGTGVPLVHASCSSEIATSREVQRLSFGPKSMRVTDAEVIKQMKLANSEEDPNSRSS